MVSEIVDDTQYNLYQRALSISILSDYCIKMNRYFVPLSALHIVDGVKVNS